jgi:hypothetical protein
MPAPIVPLDAKEAPEAPDEMVPKAAGRERREAERVITDWEDETRRLSHVLALLTLKTSEMTTEKWANRFIVALRPAIEDCTFLFYGATFAALLELPEKATPSVPMVEQLPARYVRCSREAASTRRCGALPYGCTAQPTETTDGRSSIGQRLSA